MNRLTKKNLRKNKKGNPEGGKSQALENQVAPKEFTWRRSEKKKGKEKA